MGKYFQPKSLTWWGSIAMGIAGALKGAGVDVPDYVFVIIASVTGVALRGALPGK